MQAFPDARHLASWAELSPRHNEIRGKWRPARTRRGNRTLRGTMVLCGQSAGAQPQDLPGGRVAPHRRATRQQARSHGHDWRPWATKSASTKLIDHLSAVTLLTHPRQ